jgi:hypothetical protein
MKSLFHFSNQKSDFPAKYLWRLLPEIEPSENTTNVIPIGISNTAGSFEVDTADRSRAKIKEVINQSSDAAVNSALGGGYFARMLSIEKFQGSLGFQGKLLSPLFWGASTLVPKDLIIRQVEEGFENISQPTELFGNSPLLNDQVSKALINKEQINSAIKALKNNGGGSLKDVSLTSIRLLQQVFEDRNQMMEAINEEQAADFFQKSGYNVKTGKREEQTGETFWKRWLRVLGGQRPLYRARVRQVINRNREGNEEISSILKGMEQKKEQQVFQGKQKFDAIFKAARSENNTEKLNSIQKTAKFILNRPQDFIDRPAMFENLDMPAPELFGEGFNPVDVLEFLRGAASYEDPEDNIDFLAQSTEVNEWKRSNLNALKTLENLQKRVRAQENFVGTNLETLETHVLKKYEPSHEENIDLKNPEELVNQTIQALGSATPGLVRDLHTIIQNGDIYMESTEIFWYLADFFGRGQNTNLFDKLPANIQQQFAHFLIKKREELEKSTVSGSVDEKGTLLWRIRALKQGQILMAQFDDFVNELPNLHTDLRSLEPGRAQNALRVIKTVLDGYHIFNTILGIPEGENNQSALENLLEDLPELERGILKNITQLGGILKTFDGPQGLYQKLVDDRDALETIIDQDPQWVEQRRNEYETRQELFNRMAEEGKTGFEDANVQALIGAFSDGDGSSGGGDAPGAAGLETAYTALRKDLERLDRFLNQGEDGGAIGKLEKIYNKTFDALPGNIGPAIANVAELNKRLIDRRFRELNIDPERDLDFLVNESTKPTFDFLARMELGQIASRDILHTGKSLFQKEQNAQFGFMKGIEYNSISDIVYAPARYQKKLTIAGLMNPNRIKDALYVRTDKDGSVWYHTKNQIIRFIPPQLHQDEDQRNIAIWNKPHHQRGFQHFIAPDSQPDMIGILLSSNPENEASDQNPYYGNLQPQIQDIESRISMVLH